MASVDERVREKLEKEAAQWVEEEIVLRMAYATDSIEQQAEISSVVIGEEGARKHIKEAAVFAEENIRRDLELEAAAWVEKELGERSRPMLEDRPLESNLCGD